MDRVTARAPGRVNLIGDHTDYTGGFVLPMAIGQATTIEGERGGDRVVLRSTNAEGVADVPLRVTDPSVYGPGWASHVAGVVSVLKPETGLTGQVTSTLPMGSGLSSSTALEVAIALSLSPPRAGTPPARPPRHGGAPAPPGAVSASLAQEHTPPAHLLELALMLQRAEQAASGVPCGVMDQLASLAGVAGHALLIDCSSLGITPVAIPEGLEVVVTHSGETRQLGSTAYAARRRECEAAAAIVGPLRSASPADVAAIADPVLRRRARHVVTENRRVLDVVSAMGAGDLRAAGGLLTESHASLRDDFDVSTPALDALVERLRATPGVLGARLTGAGFGGCVVALCEPGTQVDGWRVQAAGGATVS